MATLMLCMNVFVEGFMYFTIILNFFAHHLKMTNLKLPLIGQNKRGTWTRRQVRLNIGIFISG